MSESGLLNITITYDADQQQGTLLLESPTESAIWDRIRQSVTSLTDDYEFKPSGISIPWPCILSLIREYAPRQKKWNFRFRSDPTAKARIDEFLAQYRAVREARVVLPTKISVEEIKQKLISTGFTKRILKDFQLRDVQHLLSLRNGANFSVPGAGKTTVTFALHLLTRGEGQRFIVIGPKSSFLAWTEIVDECIAEDSPEWVKEPFTILTGGIDAVYKALNSGKNRYIISYDQLITVRSIFSTYLLQNPVHLVLDESHRMKGGFAVKRGSALLNMATLPVRRDILTGTPMPQAPSDLQSQLDFLWPGSGLGLRIAVGNAPRDVIKNLYVRTTKADLGLPPVEREFIQVEMGKGQAALYAVIRDETLSNLSSLKSGGRVDIVKCRRSVMRLLQLSANPVLALKSMMEDAPNIKSGIVQQILEDGPSPKMLAVRELARQLAASGRKVVIWTIFTDTIGQIERMLADLNPVTIFGAIPSGESSDLSTREGRIKRFNTDPNCMAFIANPATAGEGISLHHVCHDAIYLDRSYNSTHYLQSIDRIHRLGLPPETQTNIHIFQTKAPGGLGCIDYSVNRRLAIKLRALQQLLDDEDLHRLALDEEEVEEPIDYSIVWDDLIDLIDELESNTTYDEGEWVL